MTRVLLTGGSGFLASHILKVLLDRGHSVVVTVRSQVKIDDIRSTYYNVPSSKLDFAIVEDIAQEHAFYEAVQQNPPLEAVIHAASPFQFWTDDDIKETFLDPAINGTTSLLKAVKFYAPNVKQVVVTSSLATVTKSNASANYCSTDEDWRDVTEQDAYKSPFMGYVASKVFAEKAAWAFVENESPIFKLTTILPGYILGPIIHNVTSIDKVNASAQFIRDAIQGKFKTKIPDAGIFRWVDVRDTALAHVRAIEVDRATGQRFLVGGGYFTNREITAILWRNFPALRNNLPGPEVEGGDWPSEGVPKYDVEPSRKVLGVEYTSLEESVVGMAGSLLGLYKA